MAETVVKGQKDLKDKDKRPSRSGRPAASKEVPSSVLEVIDTLVDLLRYEGTYTQVQAHAPEDSNPVATLQRFICDSGG